MNFLAKGHEGKLVGLKKTPYILKQAWRAYNNHIDKYFQNNGFNCSNHEYALYVKSYECSGILFIAFM